MIEFTEIDPRNIYIWNFIWKVVVVVVSEQKWCVVSNQCANLHWTEHVEIPLDSNSGSLFLFASLFRSLSLSITHFRSVHKIHVVFIIWMRKCTTKSSWKDSNIKACIFFVSNTMKCLAVWISAVRAVYICVLGIVWRRVWWQMEYFRSKFILYTDTNIRLANFSTQHIKLQH